MSAESSYRSTLLSPFHFAILSSHGIARLSADGETLSLAEQSSWFMAVNKAEGRGSEWRAAAELRNARGSERLTRADFEQVYVAEMQARQLL